MLEESGPGVRPVGPDWMRSIRDQCIDASILFFKQWGTVQNRMNGRNWDGRTWDQLPHLLVTQAIVVHRHASSVPPGPPNFLLKPESPGGPEDSVEEDQNGT